jgi:hypothetical protein
MRPNSTASSGDMKLSRSTAFSKTLKWILITNSNSKWTEIFNSYRCVPALDLCVSHTICSNDRANSKSHAHGFRRRSLAPMRMKQTE